MTALVGIDIGTSSVKVVAISVDGAILATSSSPVSTAKPTPRYLEENPADWWEALKRCFFMCHEIPRVSIDIQAIGLSGHMSGLVLLDQQMKPLRPCILLADSRGAWEIEALPALIKDRIRQQTGNIVSSAFTLAKLIWVRKNEPELFEKASYALSPKDYIRYLLTREIATDPTDAGNFLLLNHSATDWDTKLIEKLDFPLNLFPPLLNSSEMAGKLAKQAADELGLSSGIPVATGAADMACTAVGSGILKQGEAAISLGTATPIVMPISEIDAKFVNAFTFHPNVLPNTRYALASILSGGRSYQWLAGLFSLSQTLDFQSLDALSEHALPGSGGALFLPFLTGGGSPDWRWNAHAAWVGLTASTTKNEIVRTVLEGVAYNCRRCIDLYSSRRQPIEFIMASGGGSGSDTWLEILADIIGLPIAVAVHSEASAIGAAILAGVCAHFYTRMDDAIAKIVKIRKEVLPNSKRVEAYQSYYYRYLRVEQQMTEVDSELAKELFMEDKQ